MNLLKSINPQLALASVFALLSLITVLAGQYGHNGYFTIAAAAFVVATYVTYPPAWAVELSRLLVGKANGKK